VPWVSIPDAKRCHGGVINDTEESTNALGIANSSARLIPAGAVCLSRTASVGYVAITGRPMATSQDFVNWICGDQLQPEFLQHLFLAEGENLLRFASGAVHKTIYFPEVKAFHVCVPDMVAQRRIVAILDEVFEGIATAKANVEKNLQNTREWSARQLATALGAASAGGRSDTLERLVAPSCTLSYGIVQPGDEVSGGLPVVRPVDLGGKTVYVDGLKRINPALARSYARTTLEGNDLLLCVRGTTGTVAMADPALAGANVTRGIVPIRFDPQTISQALGYYLLRSEPVQAQIRAKTYGTALMQINIGDLRKIVIAFPPLEKQAALVGQLDAIQEAADRLADVYARKLAALDELKHSLLHQAFAGGLSPQNDRPLHVHDLPLCTQ
jgi:type I restriction enzyme S subunit